MVEEQRSRDVELTKIISLFNQAGGVGKTTLAVNLGYHLFLQKMRVLLVDMDPQATMTSFLGLEPEEVEVTVADALVDDWNGEELNEVQLPILKNIHNMDLVPSNINLSPVELSLVNAEMRDIRLKDALDPFVSNYDFILIDCPPSLGLLSYISLVASTHILVPIECHYKSFLGTELLIQTVARIKRRANRKIEIAGFIPSKYDGRRNHDRSTVTSIKERYSGIGAIFSPMPMAIGFADASAQGAPLALHDRNNKALKILEQIAQKLKEL